MDIKKLNEGLLGRLNPRIATWLFNRFKNLPVVERKVEQEFDNLLDDLEAVVKPYRQQFDIYSAIPDTGREASAIIAEMQALSDLEQPKWKDGYASGAVYHGDAAHIDFLNQVYTINSQSNPLHTDLWPSSAKYESEIVSMTARMLGAGPQADAAGSDREICGVVTSGGTESILLAMKTYRDWARDQKNITQPEIIVPVSAHAAFDKAAEYFKIDIKRIPVAADYRADVTAAREAITRRTIALIGSAPCFPHGVVDPIEELSELAREKDIGFHTDACLGGFVLPWAEQLGYAVPLFDFRLPGVTSISADTHKYGYAAKGTSVILYRNPALRRYSVFYNYRMAWRVIFFTHLRRQPSGCIKRCLLGRNDQNRPRRLFSGHPQHTGSRHQNKKGIEGIPELYILGDPLWVIAFGSRTLDIYQIMDYLAARRWSLNGLHHPACVHLCVTLRHTQPGVTERFIHDLKAAVDFVRQNPDQSGTMAPIYGLAANLPVRSLVGDLLRRYIDLLYKL